MTYSNSFNTEASFDLLTVLDNNNDGVTWHWERQYSGGGRATYYRSATNDADDWLLMPPINLERGATYSISFDANTAISNDVDYLDVAYGQGLNTERYETLIDHIVLNEPITHTYRNDTIVPAKTGVYYFGFHCTSVANYGWLLLKQVLITKVKDAPALTGDVNADGVVDIIDVNIIVNIMLGRDNADNYDGRAYVTNGDQDIDIADANTIINIMLGK